MKIIQNEDIIQYWKENDNTILILPCNKGNKKDGTNVMGRGLAKDVATLLPFVPKLLGEYILSELEYSESKQLDYCDNTITSKIHYPTKLFFFFTKARNLDQPYLSWKHQSDLKTIESSLLYLQKELMCSFNNKYTFLLPKVGCGNGGLNYEDVKPLLLEYLSDFDNVMLFE